MIKRGSECSTEVREHMRGGEGQVLVTNLFEKNELMGKSRMFGTLTLEPGCGIGIHPHENEQEYYYVVKGNPVYRDDDQETQLHEGDVTICEDGHSHGITNRSDETVVVLACILLK
ncbi:MAG: cupin domain-containing protein [Erysipelotrichaceae bacterium]|nr:cupin domain-containing protein [Erysipelotrichaceae bacterium]MBR2534400.1 cupin domain-containing protein [Erysipelotrichaceae bacterium]